MFCILKQKEWGKIQQLANLLFEAESEMSNASMNPEIEISLSVHYQGC